MEKKPKQKDLIPKRFKLPESKTAKLLMDQIDRNSLIKRSKAEIIGAEGLYSRQY